MTGLILIGDPESGSKLTNVETTEPNTKIRTYHAGVFKNDKLVDWLTENQSRSLNIINDKVNSSMTSIACGNTGYLGLEIINTDAEKKASVKGNTPKIEINIKKETDIADVSCDVNLTDSREISKLEKMIEGTIQTKTEDSVKEIQEMKADLFGFGEEFKKSHFKYWETVESNWEEVFSNQLEVDINIDIHIRGTGTTNQSFIDEIKENIEEEEDD